MADNLAASSPTPTAESSSAGPHSAIKAAIVVAAGGALVFEQSPLNEIIRTNAGFTVLEHTRSAVAVGLVVAALTVLIELVPALLITLGLHSSGGAVTKLKARMGAKHGPLSDAAAHPPPPSSARRMGSWGTDVAVALGLGAGLVTMRRHVADPHPTVRKDVNASVQATAIVSVVSGMIGYLVGGGLANAERFGLGTPAAWIIDYGTDTRFWVGLIVVGYGLTLVVRFARRRLGSSADPETPAGRQGGQEGKDGEVHDGWRAFAGWRREG
ncbi:MAG: hypothetical protein R2754_01590 [Microthrixaceae bacterium]